MKRIIQRIIQKITQGIKINSTTKKILMRSSLITLGCVGVVLIIGLIVGRNLIRSLQVDTVYEAYEPKEERHSSDKKKKDKSKLQDKNIMVFGVDKGESRTDTILIAHIDSKTEKISVISVPRDTKVDWSDKQQDKADELGKYSKSYSKITDMSSLGGIENLRHFTIRSVEEMLDVRIDNYVVVNTQVVRDIVDSLGGIEVDVPRRMEYDDNSQDLHIDLYPGLQVLNGAQAEGLLRWRHNKDYSQQYGLGDLGRIETQQLFIKAFADQVINDLSINKVIEVATAVYANIKTDMGMNEMLNYLNYIPYLKVDNIQFDTLPGDSQMIDGLSYYLLDDMELPYFVDEYFYGIERTDRPIDTQYSKGSQSESNDTETTEEYNESTTEEETEAVETESEETNGDATNNEEAALSMEETTEGIVENNEIETTQPNSAENIVDGTNQGNEQEANQHNSGDSIGNEIENMNQGQSGNQTDSVSPNSEGNTMDTSQQEEAGNEVGNSQPDSIANELENNQSGSIGNEVENNQPDYIGNEVGNNQPDYIGNEVGNS